jgi:predicted glycoside hydrolase/deacetylase ChbG (UPF0249 family)
MRALIVEADDLGLCRSLNAGIRAAAAGGVLTSTCIRVNGAAFEEAVAEVVPEFPALGLGVHLNIVEGATTRPTVPHGSPLVDPGGGYRMSFPALLWRQRDRRLLAEIEADYRHQIETALARLPRVDHLNSHQHSHAVPALFEIVCRLAVEYDIPFVRLPRERFVVVGSPPSHFGGWYAANLVKVALLNNLARTNAESARRLGARTNDWFVGIAYTGRMNHRRIVGGLRAVPRDAGLVEVLAHPSLSVGDPAERFLDAAVRSYVMHPSRGIELTALVNPALREALTADGWTLTTYGRIGDLAGQR